MLPIWELREHSKSGTLTKNVIEREVQTRREIMSMLAGQQHLAGQQYPVVLFDEIREIERLPRADQG